MAKQAKAKAKVNPFDKGVTYAEFKKALGKDKVGDYLKNICSTEQIEFIKNELSLIK